MSWILNHFTKTILLPFTVNEPLAGHWRIACFHSFDDIEKPGKIVFCSCESALENPESVRKKKEKKKKEKRVERRGLKCWNTSPRNSTVLRIRWPRAHKVECARSFGRVAGWNQVEYRAGTSLDCLRWGNLTEEWHGELAGQENQLASHNRAVSFAFSSLPFQG